MASKATPSIPNVLLYARGGNEFAAEQDLRETGFDVWCGRKMVWTRRGKQRRAEAREVPALPNYIFARLAHSAISTVLRSRFLAPTWFQIHDGHAAKVQKWQREVDARFSADARVATRDEVVKNEYDPGQRLEVIAGPFFGHAATFRRMVEAVDIPRLEIDLEGGLAIKIDPLDVRKVG